MSNLCPYCSEPMITTPHHDPRSRSRDHVIPLSRGGPDHRSNIVWACRACNELKASLDAEEFLAWRAGLASRLDMLKKPRRHRPYNVWDADAKEWRPNPLNAQIGHPRIMDHDKIEIAAVAMERRRRELIERPLATIWRELAKTALQAIEGRPSGFFASLTPEQQKAALEYRGSENHGDPDGPKAPPSEGMCG